MRTTCGPVPRAADRGIAMHGGDAPLGLPAGYVGPAWLPGTGRMIWWTGRVAIGLRHEAPHHDPAMPSPGWVQPLILSSSSRPS